MNNIYMDNAATTPVRKEVIEAMMPYFSEYYGNPSSLYKLGKISKIAIDTAREQVANAIGASSDEIYFTSGGTESDNWALRGVEEWFGGGHIITSSIEHHAVLNTCKYLEWCGSKVTYLPVDEYGLVSPEEVRNAMRHDTFLISIMFANNELGTIQPIAEIGKITKNLYMPFHTDAVQAIGHIPINVKELNIDLLSISGHKIYAPKGVGALYVSKECALKPILHGGHQESGLRAGTENVPAIVGLGKAIELAVDEMEAENQRLINMRDKMIKSILQTIPNCHLNGHPDKRLPGNINISFDGVEGESVVLMLDNKGIAVSSGSACTSGSLEPSHVLTAIGLTPEQAHSAIRISLGKYNTFEESEKVVAELGEVVSKLRKMSPLT